MKRYPRGSAWRKWDLHVHPPGTKLNDCYEKKEGQPDWNRFCKEIHDSDVEAFGITDYFSLDGFFAFKEKYDLFYPDADKVFFPNLELRLNETVNREVDLVDLHIIFPPNLTRDKADEFLRSLKTQLTDTNGRLKSCSELQGNSDFESASVSRDDLKKAIESTYGSKAVWTDHFLLIAAVNNSGIRPDTSNQRKMALSDELDKFVNAFFGNPNNTDYYLDPNRLEAVDQRIQPKPVFAGCDSHSFEELKTCLGTEVTIGNEKHPTWIKADLTFEGLQQTLVEPSERIKIQSFAPDKKEPYKVISRIIFQGSDDFPDEVIFNPGLNAIIGSRSSGKSALLAYLAHTIDADYTLKQQIAAGIDEKDAGPGASFTWEDVKHINCSVEWASPTATTGQVIFIPQNSLNAISERPDDITAKIQPAVFRNAPNFEAEFRRNERAINSRNKSISDAVDDWFTLEEEVHTLSEEIRGLGDRKAVEDRQAELVDQIKALQESSTLTEEDLKQYQKIVGDISKNEARIQEIHEEEQDLSAYVQVDSEESIFKATDQVSVRIEMIPSPDLVSMVLKNKLEAIIEEASVQLLNNLKTCIADYRANLDIECRGLIKTNTKLKTENKDLIEKNETNTQIAALVQDLKDQEETLTEIGKKSALSKVKIDKQSELISSISADIKGRDQSLDSLKDDFNLSNLKLEEMLFSIEIAYDKVDIDRVSNGFNKHENSPYVVGQNYVDVEKAQSEPEKFLQHMSSGKQKLKRGEDVVEVTKSVLTVTKDMRFVASLEGDRIGGFRKSSMTPGKQALFALTLILSETEEPWPLLIDQPEDDLDSRSICDVIVKELMKRKRERQVIMVSHNANLVIGADSEEIIVANRHGADRPNRDDKTFAYLSGSLEHSHPKDHQERFVLESAGIREHACEILDGGAEAFQKRKDKYRI